MASEELKDIISEQLRLITEATDKKLDKFYQYFEARMQGNVYFVFIVALAA